MHKLNAPWWLLLTTLVSVPAQELSHKQGIVSISELRQQLVSIISQPKYAAAFWGVKILSLDSGQTLFETNAEKLFSPASNSKLYTVALALDRLGVDFRIRTSLYAISRPNAQGVLGGDLLVYGRGDPCINARLHGGDIFRALQPLVAALTNGNVRRITGDLIGDSSFFHGPAWGSGWDWDDAEYSYGAEISALTINDNVLPIMIEPGDQLGLPCRLVPSFGAGFLSFSNRTETVQADQRRRLSFFRPLDGNLVYVNGRFPLRGHSLTQEMTIHNPAALFVLLFKQALARNGISVEGRTRTMDWLDRQGAPFQPEKMVELGAVESLPLSELAKEVEKPSQNLYADLLLAQVGESVRSADTPWKVTSEDLGLRELRKFLVDAGVPADDVWFEEGSGLSRNNLTTPEATVALLEYMSRQKCASEYLAALPIAGVDGTLRNRMKNTPAMGNLRAKTGTLRWAVSLSGYVTTAGGERLAFSLMLNRYHPSPPGSSPRADLDKIGVLLARFSGRSSQ